jgi:hypothetical protein
VLKRTKIHNFLSRRHHINSSILNKYIKIGT